MLVTTANDERIVKCDGCGERIESGWQRYEKVYDFMGCFIGDSTVEDEHYCDDCALAVKLKHEFRICDRCGSVMTEGFCDEEADHICEECFEDWMHESFPAGWRAVEDDGCGGYYEWYDAREQEWQGTGVYWTDWC